jgi:hypothetical protein
VNNQKLTISWHIEDLKISHMEPKTVDDFLAWLKETYAQIGELKSTRGKQHDYLGMTLDYGVPGQITIDMVDYVKSMVSFFPDTLEKPKVSAYTMVAKGLFLCKRRRADISPAIAFLTTRVHEPHGDDWEKFYLSYGRGTKIS